MAKMWHWKQQLTVLCVITVIFFCIIYFPEVKEEQLRKGEETHTLNELAEPLDLAKQWLITNVNEEGYFNYFYNPEEDTYSTKNNMIRQLMASRLLAELSQSEEGLLPTHKKNLKYIFSHWYYELDDKGYIYFSKKSKLGAQAMALRTIIYSPFFDEYEKEAEMIANTIISLQNKDGSFEPFFIEPNYSYKKDYILTFYSGEAILALVEYYEKTNDPKYLSAAEKTQEFYIDRYVTHLDENYYPAYVPWHTLALNKLYKITKNKKYADAIFILNDKLLEIQDGEDKGQGGQLGRFYNPETPQYGSPHSSSDAVYTEGLAYAYEIAKMTKDDVHKKRYQRALALAVYNLKKLQYTEEKAEQYSFPEKIRGAIRVNTNDPKIRVDTTQHMIDAFMKVQEVFGGK